MWEAAGEDCGDVATDEVKRQKRDGSPIEMNHKMMFYWGENTISQKKDSNLDVQIWHFFKGTNCYLAVVKHMFFSETVFSWARFSVRRDVFVAP